MDYTQRETKNAASRAVLSEVLELGEAAGTFRVIERKASDPDEAVKARNVQWATVETPDGCAFSLHAGSWSREGKISASVAYLHKDGIQASPRDVLAYGTTAPEAQASHERGAAVVLRELTRRIFQHPEALRVAGLVRDRWAQQAESRNTLAGNIKRMSLLGYSEPEGRETVRCHSATLYRRTTAGEAAPYTVEVDSGGSIRAEVSCSIEQFAAVLNILKGR